jgi:hypothetical protein
VSGISFASSQSVIQTSKSCSNSAHRVAKKRRVMSRERREHEHARLRGGADLREVEQAAEGLLELVDLAHRVAARTHLDRVDTELGPPVVLVRRRMRSKAAATLRLPGQVRKRAIRMAVELVGRVGKSAPRLHRRALPVVDLIEHFSGVFFLCCSAVV